MSVLVTVAGYNYGPKAFQKDVLTFLNDQDLIDYFPKSFYVDWEEGNALDVLEDMVSNRKLEPLIHETVDTLAEAFAYAIEHSQNVAIVSFSTGSLLVELALKFFTDNYVPEIRHLMLAPAINGGHIITLAKFVQPLVIAKLTNDLVKSKNHPFLKILVGAFAAKNFVDWVQNKDLIGGLFQGIANDEFNSGLNILRFVLYSKDDNIVKINHKIPNAVYFSISGIGHSQVGSFGQEELERVYDIEGDRSETTKERVLRHYFTGTVIAPDFL